MSFYEFYNANKGNADEIEEAKNRLVRYPLSDNLVGEQKLIDLDSTDMESKMTTPFNPALFYTFMYEAENDVISGIKFSDNIPLILSFGKTGKYVEGLNFNLLPNECRAIMLDIMNKSTGNYYTEKGLEDAMEGKASVNESIAQVLMNGEQRLQFIRLMEQNMGVSIGKAYRKYNISHIKNPRMIEYGDYKYIPLLFFEESIRGANIVNLQKKVVEKS